MDKKIVWTLNYKNEPTPFLVESETRNMYSGRQEGFFKKIPIGKQVNKKKAFATFLDAKSFAVKAIDKSIQYLEEDIQRKKTEKQRINNMKHAKIPKWMKK